MARKRKTASKAKASPDVAEAPRYRYVGPPYPAVRLDGLPTFVPATITQARIAELMERYPDKASRFFELNTRVKPGIETDATGQEEE